MPAAPRTDSRKGGRRLRAPLTRERIISAALGLADTRGGFSMRALGHRLGSDPMAVYRHFRDKEALQDAMVDAALASLERPDPGSGSPVERLRAMSLAFRAALQEHPGVATRVSTTRPTLGPHTVAMTEACLEILCEMGLDARDATRAFVMVIRFITGVVIGEERVLADGMTEEHWIEEMRAGYASLPPETFPHVAAMASEVTNLGLDADFEFGLDLLFEGLVRKGAASGREPDRGLVA